MLETLQIISFIITITTGGIALLFTLSKPFRKWLLTIKSEKEKETERELTQKETDMCLLRDRISSIYFKHYRDCEIKEYEFENVESLYRQYKKLGGNSFVDKVWREMQDWLIIP